MSFWKGKEAVDRRLVSDAPDSSRNHVELGIALAFLGRWGEAAEVLETACSRFRQQRPCGWSAVALYRADRQSEARRVAEEASTLDDHLDGTYQLARYHALTGDRSAALSYMQRSLEAYLRDRWIAHDPDLQSLHGDPQFEAIVSEVRKRNGEE